MPAVSVVIPTYNRAGTIMAAVQSVLRQSFTDFELIIVDDGSADDTVIRLEALDEPRLKVLRHEVNRGVSAARNTGVMAAQAPLVAFQDSDDEWLPDKLQRQLACLEAADPSCVAAYCGMIIVGQVTASAHHRTRVRYFPESDIGVVEGDILPTLLRRSLISTQTLIAKRDRLLEIGVFDESLLALEDWDLMLRLARLGPIGFVDQPLVIQRFSSDSITRSTPKWLAARIRVLEKNADLLASRPDIAAHHQVTMAGIARELGRNSEALGHIARAIRLRPLRLRTWLSLVLLLWRSLAHRSGQRT